MIDWLDEKSKVSNHFTVKEMLFLPHWGRLATEADGLTEEVKNNLILLAAKADVLRELFNSQMIVHVTFRPEEYNKLVGGAPGSSHLVGLAMDFHVSGMNCDYVRGFLLPKLEELHIRIEDRPGSDWVHFDLSPPHPNRFFKP